MESPGSVWPAAAGIAARMQRSRVYRLGRIGIGPRTSVFETRAPRMENPRGGFETKTVCFYSTWDAGTVPADNSFAVYVGWTVGRRGVRRWTPPNTRSWP
jgi:hypothetical protein